MEPNVTTATEAKKKRGKKERKNIGENSWNGVSVEEQCYTTLAYFFVLRISSFFSNPFYMQCNATQVHGDLVGWDQIETVTERKMLKQTMECLEFEFSVVTITHRNTWNENRYTRIRLILSDNISI